MQILLYCGWSAHTMKWLCDSCSLCPDCIHSLYTISTNSDMLDVLKPDKLKKNYKLAVCGNDWKLLCLMQMMDLGMINQHVRMWGFCAPLSGIVSTFSKNVTVHSSWEFSLLSGGSAFRIPNWTPGGWKGAVSTVQLGQAQVLPTTENGVLYATPFPVWCTNLCS